MATNKTAAANLGADLRVAIGRTARRLRDLYAAAEDDLSFGEVSVLSRLLRTGASSPSALADRERVTPQAIGGILVTLQKRGLVARKPDPCDGRKLIVTITGAGRRALRDRSRVVSGHLARALDEELQPAEQEKLAAALPLLDRLADRL